MGLTGAQAAERLAGDGPNELTPSSRRTLAANAAAIVREPMSLLLVACGAIYFVLGDLQEALMLLGFVLFIMGITLFQEQKTEHAIEALRDLASPRALVVRDGRRVRIAGRDVVRDDVMVLAEGDRVAADATLLESSHLAVDESLLTGESASVRKVPWDRKAAVARPGGEDLPFVFAGTLIVQGAALARVHATGARTEMGRIGRALERTRVEDTPLQRETRSLVKRLAWLAGALSVVAGVGYGVARGSVLGGLLAGITLAMAILPNEFPVVVTIFLALGAWRLSRRRVLTRRMPAIEAIGTATVLCVDKTGTLTQNRMTVRELSAGGDRFDVRRLDSEALPEAFHEVVEFSILASRKDPFDPMERAFKELGERQLVGTEHLHDDWTLLKEYPLSHELLAMAQVWRSSGRAEPTVAAKGAPEAIADLCHLTAEELRTMGERVDALAADGLRVLGVARGVTRADPLPGRAHDVDFRFLGLVGLEDPIREDVPEAIAECHRAGIRVVMITGDYPATAESIARQIGIAGAEVTITGAELCEMLPGDLQRRIRTATVFARVLPEQKLQIVEALQASGEIVVMTGDGVNDAPALKAANIGVAMGGRGTDVAREASTIVLLDDDFASLVQAVKSGRRILDNLRKALAYILAVHLPIIGLTLIPIFMGWPLVLLPIHIAFLHLVIDPACSVVFEAEPGEADVMLRPPRNPRVPLFGRRPVTLSLVQGAIVMLVVVGVFGVALGRGQGELESRALTFTTFMVANLGLIFTNRSWSATVVDPLQPTNRALWWVTGGAVAFLALVLYVPGLRGVFRFAPLDPQDLALCLVAGVSSVVWFELFKVVTRRRTDCAGPQASRKPCSRGPESPVSGPEPPGPGVAKTGARP
jgi:Ca2+-transporting ATPase